jgi:F0F1-type ATP synthase membrane subunit b/b'
MTIIPDPVTAIVMTIPFIITYFALNYILFRPLFAYLEERDHVVHDAKHETQDLTGKIEQQMATLEQKLRGARDEAAAVRATARHAAHEQETAIIAAARAEADAHVDEAIKAIHAEEKTASATMKATATELSTDIAKQVLGREVRA